MQAASERTGRALYALPLDVANRYDAYKDWIRTNEIRARQMMNGR